jgi:Bacterial Ig-like domain (group 3)
VRLSLGRVWKIQSRRAAVWCALFLGIIAGAKAQETAVTQTALAVATDNAGPRTRTTLNAHVHANAFGVPGGVVNFRSGDLDLGSAVLDSEGNASLQTGALTPGAHQVVAIYKGQALYQASVSSARQVRAEASTVAGFTVTATPSSLSTAAGGFVDVVVTVTPNNGFSGYVNLSCSGLPVQTTCTFSPVSVAAICTSTTACPAGTSALQIQTQQISPGVVKSTGAAALVLPLLLGLAGLGARKRRAWRNVALGLIAFVGALGLTSCAQRYNYLNHGPPDNPGTTYGTYAVTIESQSSNGSDTITPPSNPQLTLTVTAPAK